MESALKAHPEIVGALRAECVILDACVAKCRSQDVAGASEGMEIDAPKDEAIETFLTYIESAVIGMLLCFSLIIFYS